MIEEVTARASDDLEDSAVLGSHNHGEAKVLYFWE